MVHLFVTQPKLRDKSQRDRKLMYSGNPGSVQLRRNYILVGETQLHILPLGRYFRIACPGSRNLGTSEHEREKNEGRLPRFGPPSFFSRSQLPRA